MKKFIRRFYRKQGGFTLIELLVVIAILGILAAIIVPSVTRYISSGNEAANQTEEKIVQNAVFAAMASAKIDTISYSGASFPVTIDKTNDLDVLTGTVAAGVTTVKTRVGAYLTGGVDGLAQSYDVLADGTVSVTPPPASP